jgi:photosystem II stability/assembly factor-like uncharacterized protein
VNRISVTIVRRLATASAAVIAAAAIHLLAGCSSSTAPVTPFVPAPPLDSLSISADSVVVAVGQQVQLTATAFDTTGALVSGGLTWSSTDPVVVTVDGSGRITGKVEGAAFVKVSGGGLVDSAFVVVTSALRGWFQQQSNSTNYNLNGVYFRPDGRTGWAAGTGGRIIFTTDAGATWTAQNTPTTLNIESIWFTSATNGWAVGSTGLVLRTTNGGGSWSRLLTVPAGEQLNDVWFVNASLGWIVGGAGVVLRTTDGGANWDRLSPSTFQLHSVSFSDANNGWIVGDNGIILGTRNGGNSWYTVQPSVTGQSLRAVWRRSVAVANAAGYSGNTPRTLAAADSALWELQNSGSNNQLEGVCFPTDLIGYVCGYNGTGAILVSADGGASWFVQDNTGMWGLNDIFFIGPNHGWAVGDNGTVLHTTTGGLP